MKPTVISADALFEEHRPALQWEWIAGHAHPVRRFDEAAVRNAQSAADLVGYLNYIHPYRGRHAGHFHFHGDFPQVVGAIRVHERNDAT